ncbi:MAG: glycosyltransferase [Desulfobacterales bacterium]|nr:glycosyltransferase [Desulfobacterales bacterium]
MPLENPSGKPLVSILICSRDRRTDLEKIVQDLKAMDTIHSFDIVVVEETDAPRPIAGVRYIAHAVKNLGFAHARNLSIAQAKADIVVFVDDDCQISEGWLDNLLRPFVDEAVVGAQGGVVVPGDTNAIGWTESLLGFPGGGVRRVVDSGGFVQETMEISTLNSAYRKDVVQAIGGFSHGLKWGSEDYLLAKKACRHGKCLFVPDALVAHRARGSFLNIWDWFVRRGRAEVGVVRSREYAAAGWSSVLRSSLLLKLLLLSMLGLFFPMGWLLLLFLSFYTLLQYYRIWPVWRRGAAPFLSLVLVPIVKLTMDLAADIGRLTGILSD